MRSAVKDLVLSLGDGIDFLVLTIAIHWIKNVLGHGIRQELEMSTCLCKHKYFRFGIL